MENVIYYYVVYIIVILVKLHKYLRQDERLINAEKYGWLVIFDGLDLAFSAAGVIIYLFLESESKWYSTIFSLAILLYFLAFFADSLSNKYSVIKKGLNVTVLIVVFFVTYIVFAPNQNVFGITLNTIQKHNDISNRKNYKVVIPYQDLTLIAHLGINKSNNVFLLYECEIEDSLKSNAIDKAYCKFLNDTSIMPLLSNKKENKNYKLRSSFVRYSRNNVFVKEE